MLLDDELASIPLGFESNGFFHAHKGEQKLGTLQAFREQENSATLTTLWTSFPKSPRDFQTNYQQYDPNGIWDIVCEACPMGTYAYDLTSVSCSQASFQVPARRQPASRLELLQPPDQTSCTKKCPVGRFY